MKARIMDAAECPNFRPPCPAVYLGKDSDELDCWYRIKDGVPQVDIYSRDDEGEDVLELEFWLSYSESRYSRNESWDMARAAGLPVEPLPKVEVCDCDCEGELEQIVNEIERIEDGQETYCFVVTSDGGVSLFDDKGNDLFCNGSARDALDRLRELQAGSRAAATAEAMQKAILRNPPNALTPEFLREAAWRIENAMDEEDDLDDEDD